MLFFNTASSLAAMNIFKAGSGAAIGLAIAGMVLGNALALFGIPVAGGKAADPALEEKK